MISDSEILSMKKVSPQMAARYLGVADDFIYLGLQNGDLPFGVATKNEKSGRWTYDIRPMALVRYNRQGVNSVDDRFADIVAEKVIEKIRREPA